MKNAHFQMATMAFWKHSSEWECFHSPSLLMEKFPLKQGDMVSFRRGTSEWKCWGEPACWCSPGWFWPRIDQGSSKTLQSLRTGRSIKAPHLEQVFSWCRICHSVMVKDLPLEFLKCQTPILLIFVLCWHF